MIDDRTARRLRVLDLAGGDLSEAERNRFLDGRRDWRESDWQDHCGDLDCEHCAGAVIPSGNL